MDLTETLKEVFCLDRTPEDKPGHSVLSDWYYVAREDVWKADIRDYDKINIAFGMCCLHKQRILDYNGYKYFRFLLKELEKSYRFNWGIYLI
jgi:hypothetical protein